MRKVCLATVFAFVLANPAPAQNWANKLFDNGTPNAPIVQDFGVVARGAQLEAKLSMTNIWKVPLEISRIHVSCGCVEAKASKMILQPNERAELHIKMDGTRFTGPKVVNINVTVGPQFVSTANIIVSANARQDVVLNPGEIDFGNIQRGSSVERSLDVECAGKPGWKVTQITKSPTAPFDLKSESLPPRQNNGALVVGYRLIATLKPDVPVGPFREPVDLITNDPTQQKVTFIVAGTVQPTVTVQPNPVQPVGLKLGVVSNSRIYVTANQAFRITNIRGNDADAKLIIPDSLEKSQSHMLELNIMPKAPGLLNREFVVETDMRNESVKVIVKGNVNP